MQGSEVKQTITVQCFQSIFFFRAEIGRCQNGLSGEVSMTVILIMRNFSWNTKWFTLLERNFAVLEWLCHRTYWSVSHAYFIEFSRIVSPIKLRLRNRAKRPKSYVLFLKSDEGKSERNHIRSSPFARLNPRSRTVSSQSCMVSVSHYTLKSMTYPKSMTYLA